MSQEEAAPADFQTGWAAVRDATIRPFTEWRVNGEVSLPPMPRPAQSRPTQNGQGGGHWNQSGGAPRHAHNGHPQKKNGDGQKGGRRRRKKRGGPNGNASFNGRPSGGGRDRERDRDRFRERGPRLPGFYNPGGD
jgi:hypothetical protein